MAKARRIAGITAQTPFGLAAAAAVEVRAAEVFEHAQGVLDFQDIERVHDMRVATRRLRAVMEIFAPAFPRDHYRELLEEVKGLADALGERRDPDVQIEALGRVAAKVAPGDRAGIRGIVRELRTEQQAGNRALAGALAHIEAARLEQRLAELAADARARAEVAA